MGIVREMPWRVGIKELRNFDEMVSAVFHREQGNTMLSTLSAEYSAFMKNMAEKDRAPISHMDMMMWYACYTDEEVKIMMRPKHIWVL